MDELKAMRKLILMALLIPTLGLTHGGRVDGNGGHNDRKAGEYHCHREPCFSNRSKTNQATQDAIKEKRSFSYIYKRDDWRHWSDLDNDCMDTRNETLKSQASGTVKLTLDGCKVIAGLWLDPFSGNEYSNTSDLDVDHIIPLKWAHMHGASNWSKRKKEQFANDPANLLAVYDRLNQSKGAKGPDAWMPPNHGFRCKYLEKWQHILRKYSDLELKSSENRVFQKQLKSCSLN